MYRQIGNEIGFQAQEKGLSVVKSYCGHGIGKLFHTCPNISHYPKNKTPGIMQVIYFWRLVKIDFLERACVHYWAYDQPGALERCHLAWQLDSGYRRRTQERPVWAYSFGDWEWRGNPDRETARLATPKFPTLSFLYPTKNCVPNKSSEWYMAQPMCVVDFSAWKISAQEIEISFLWADQNQFSKFYVKSIRSKFVLWLIKLRSTIQI